MRTRCCALVLLMIPHAACVPPAASPPFSKFVVSKPLVMNEYGEITMGKRLIPVEDLEEMTRCNPAAHAKAVAAGRLSAASWVFGGALVAGLTTSLWMLGAMGFSSTPKEKMQASVVGLGGSALALVSLIFVAALPSSHDRALSAVKLYNKGRPPCGPPLHPAAPAKDR
jgi:hypothetical protein